MPTLRTLASTASAFELIDYGVDDTSFHWGFQLPNDLFTKARQFDDLSFGKIPSHLNCLAVKSRVLPGPLVSLHSVEEKQAANLELPVYYCVLRTRPSTQYPYFFTFPLSEEIISLQQDNSRAPMFMIEVFIRLFHASSLPLPSSVFEDHIIDDSYEIRFPICVFSSLTKQASKGLAFLSHHPARANRLSHTDMSHWRQGGDTAPLIDISELSLNEQEIRFHLSLAEAASTYVDPTYTSLDTSVMIDNLTKVIWTTPMPRTAKPTGHLYRIASESSIFSGASAAFLFGFHSQEYASIAPLKFSRPLPISQEIQRDQER